jgi:hypothetical protein
MGRVKHKQLTQFTQQLSVLMDAGLPIVRSLKILGNQQKPGLLKNIVVEVSEDVETGSSFSEALAKHPKSFDKLYVNMVKAGEAGGVLEDLIAYWLGGNRFRLVVNAGTAEKACAWLLAKRNRCAVAVTIEPRRDLAIIAVQGPRARDKTWDALPALRAATECVRWFHRSEHGLRDVKGSLTPGDRTTEERRR